MIKWLKPKSIKKWIKYIDKKIKKRAAKGHQQYFKYSIFGHNPSICNCLNKHYKELGYYTRCDSDAIYISWK